MIRLKNNLLIKNIIIILISNLLVMLLFMINKITYTKILGINTISVYSIVMPTLSLIYNLSSFGFIISISKITALKKYKDEDILKNAKIINIIISIILIILVIFFSKIIAKTLHNTNYKYIIISSSLLIPFIGITSIFKGFMYGKEKMFFPSLLNIIEEIIKLILIIFILPIVITSNDIINIIYLVIFNFVTEVFSYFFLKHKINNTYIIKKGKYNKNIFKEIFMTSFITTLIRLISAVFMFLEPIIYTNTYLKLGFSIKYLTLEYSIINSYIISIFSFPSFFGISVSSALLPNITLDYKNKRYSIFNKKILYLTISTIIFGIVSIFIILFNINKFLLLFFNSNKGINYAYLLGPFFIFIYITPIFSSVMQAINKVNKLLYVTIISNSLKIIIFIILCMNKFGITAYLYAIIVEIIITFITLFYLVIKKSNYNN